jgi:hypothetical protein
MIASLVFGSVFGVCRVSVSLNYREVHCCYEMLISFDEPKHNAKYPMIKLDSQIKEGLILTK